MPISIVLDHPENPDNIGAVCRAMKNMDFDDLRLVSPPEDWQVKSRKMAVNACDMLETAKVYRKLKDAVSETGFVIGTTRRLGSRRRAFLEFDEAMEKISKAAKRQTVAVVFGKESRGLSNESLSVCDWFTTLPTGEACPSVNLAQAVMIVCFSLFTGKVSAPGYHDLTYVTKKEFENIMKVFNRDLHHLQYKPAVVARIDKTFRSMLQRAGLLKSEGEMIKGLSRRIYERSVKKKY